MTADGKHAPETISIREALLQASSLLARHGAEDGRADAERLLMHLFGWDRSRLLLDWHEPFPAELREAWRAMLERRAAGEPVQYITGEQEFLGLSFEVNADVLIPRPETELLVEAVIRLAGGLWGDAPFTAADIGTGSGAIAVSLAKRMPACRVLACDLSERALATAGRNAARHGVAERVELLRGDLLLPLAEAGRHADALVSNPPYVESGDIPRLARHVRDFEPRMALDGGPDGLDFYRRIIGQIGLLPEVPRLVAFETGMGQAGEVAAMLRRAGHWDDIAVIRDYAGIERHVTATARGGRD